MSQYKPHSKKKTNFFEEITKVDKLSKTFYFIKYHTFWLGYESVMGDVFLLQRVISNYNSCDIHGTKCKKKEKKIIFE